MNGVFQRSCELGILEKTRAILVSRLGPLIEESSADVEALKRLVIDLEEARSDITEGLGALEREVEYLENHERGGGREASLEKIEADIAEGDHVLFHGMGAYSAVTSTRFNGFGGLSVATVLALDA